MERTYLDYAATTPTHPEVVEAMLPFFTEVFGNPSSIYSIGLEARDAVDQSRRSIAAFLGAREEEIVFTSGGTEADNLALQGVAIANEKKGNHIIVSSIEHHAIIETCKFMAKHGFEVTYLPVDEYGFVDPDDVRKAITPKTVLVSVMHANNEIGTIEPIKEISAVARERGVLFHTDAVQTAGHIPVNVGEMGVDLLSLSGHKLYGPKGVGLLYVRKGVRIASHQHGGEQEKKRRAGTENVPGIVGLAKAVEIASKEMDGEAARLQLLRGRLINTLPEKIDHIRLNGHPTARLPNNVNFSFEFIEGESIVLNLDFEGICASTGSACSSASLEPSHVLLGIGCAPEVAHGSIRMTMGKWTTDEDIERVIEALPRVVKKLRAMSPLLKSGV